mmetsp:Transcript_47517/g.149336  ORF Transcript_47517/g.149336 Transcript_47517/m.149336 type:complete len:182 (-) Transcript_47517:132-677(-)
MAPLRLRHLLLLSAALASARSHGSIFDAVAADSMQKLKAALEADPSALDVTGPGGQSPLMHAVLTGKAKAVKYLLKRGADVTVPEKDGYTPMHGAGFQGRAEIARLLMAHGVDAWDVHSDGHAPMQRACWGGEPRHTETVAVFIEAGASAEALEKCEAATRNAATKAAVARAVEASKKAEL